MENANEKKTPLAVECEPGTYAWCTCGLSAKFPHCNGEHARQETGKTPHIHIVGSKTTVYLCQCKKSGNGVYCDGSHNNTPKE